MLVPVVLLTVLLVITLVITAGVCGYIRWVSSVVLEKVPSEGS